MTDTSTARALALRDKLVSKTCEHGHPHPISCICTQPSCSKRFLCLSCVLTDNDHFCKHKDHIVEISDYLSKHMIADASSFEEELSKKEAHLAELEALKQDASNSIHEIFEDIDQEYEGFKKAIVEAVDGIRDTLKAKFEAEVENRSQDIVVLTEKLEALRSRQDLDSHKELEASKLLELLGNAPHIGSEFYFTLYNFLNIDKSHEKAFKNVLLEVEEYKKLFKSKKFEAFGRLFQEYQKQSALDHSRIQELANSFSASEHKGAISKKFKEKIDSVFNSEINATSFYTVKPKAAPPSLQAKAVRTSTIFNEAAKKEEEEASSKGGILKPSASEKEAQLLRETILGVKAESDPQLQKILESPLVQKLLQNNQKIIDRLDFKQRQDEQQKRQSSMVMATPLQPGRREAQTSHNNLPQGEGMDTRSVSERLNINMSSYTTPLVKQPGIGARGNMRARLPQQQSHLSTVRAVLQAKRAEIQRPHINQNPNLHHLQQQQQPQKIQPQLLKTTHEARPQKQMPVPAQQNQPSIQELAIQRMERLRSNQEAREHHRKRLQMQQKRMQFERLQHQQQQLRARQRMQPRSMPAERAPNSFLGKRMRPAAQEYLQRPQYRQPVPKRILETPSQSGTLSRIPPQRTPAVSRPQTSLSRPVALSKKKKTRNFTQDLQGQVLTNRSLNLKDSVVKNIARLTSTVKKPQNSGLGYSFEIKRSYDGMQAKGVSSDTLRNGGTFIFTGHSSTDFIEFQLDDAKPARKIILEPPCIEGKGLAGRLQKVEGAKVEVKSSEGTWTLLGKVSFGGQPRAEIPIGRQISAFRLRKGDSMKKFASLGVGRVVLLQVTSQSLILLF